MNRYPYELVFIRRLNAQGESFPVDDKLNNQLQETDVRSGYTLNPLSVSEGTYIASGFNTFVVKLRGQVQQNKRP